jgi:hypothetical protein
MNRALITFAVSTFGLTCPVGPLDSPPVTIPVEDERPAQVIWIPQDYPWQFDARPGDTVNLIMMSDDPGANKEGCEGSGGQYVQNTLTDIDECWNVDF